MTKIMDYFIGVFSQNILASGFFILLLTMYLYPVFYIRSEYLRRIFFVAVLYRKFILIEVYSSKLTLHDKGVFKFTHELLDNDIIDYNNILNFEDLFVRQNFLILKSRQQNINDHQYATDDIIRIIEEQVVVHQLIIIEGKAGSGKSNFLKYLGNLVINKNSVFKYAMYFEAKELESYILADDSKLKMYERFFKYAKISLCAAIHFCYRRKGMNVSYREINKRLKNKCLLLVDGMDEIRNTELVDEFTELLRTFKDEYSNLTVVVTGRPGALPKESTDSNHPDHYFKICNMNLNQVNELIKKNFKHIYAPNTYIVEYHEFTRRIATNNALYSLAKIPFLLILMIRLRKYRKELPENRDALINEFVELAINRRLSNQDIAAHSALYNILCKIAYDTVNRKLDKTELVKYISSEFDLINIECFSSVKKVVDYLRTSGVLIHDSNDFEFTHRSIQDNLCAKYIYDDACGDYDKVYSHECITNKNNSDIVFFLCCLFDDSTKLFKHLESCEQFSVCLDILAWRSLRKDIIIDKSSINSFWNKFSQSFDSKFVVRSRLYLLLTAIKNGEIFSRNPVTRDKYEFLMGKIDDRYVRSGEVVGLDKQKIDRFFIELNREFPSDEMGEYKPVSTHYRVEVKDSDTITLDMSGYQIARPNSNRFELIKAKLFNEVGKRLSVIITNINCKFRISDPVRALELLQQDVLSSFEPGILLNNTTQSNFQEHSENFLELKNLLIGNDLRRRDRLIRDGVINHTLIIGDIMSQHEQKTIDGFFSKKFSGVDLDPNDIELLLKGSLYRLMLSLLMQGTKTEYCYSKEIYLRALVTKMAIEKKLDLWGKLIIQFSPSVINKNH